MLDQKFISCAEAIIFIASQNGECVKGSNICQELGLPVRNMEKFLQLAVKQGLLKAHRGPQGGYVLAKEKRKLTLKDIYKVYKELTGFKLGAGKNVIARQLKQIDGNIMQDMDKINLEDLCQNYAGSFQGSVSQNSKGEVYNI